MPTGHSMVVQCRDPIVELVRVFWKGIAVHASGWQVRLQKYGWDLESTTC